MHAMSTGKRDHEGRKNDGTIMRKLNKSSSIKDVLKKGNVTSSSSHRPPLLDQFYPKFKKKKVNSRLVECLVHDKRDGEYDSEEVLIFKRRKCTPEERQKECSSSTLTSDVEQIGDKDSRMKQKQSNIVVGSGTSGNDFNVIIKWKEWYAFEKEDDEASEEALINKRTERRRQEKMKHAKIRRGCNAEDSLDSKRCKGSGENVGNSIFEAERNALSLSDIVICKTAPTDELQPPISWIQTDLPILDSSNKTGMVDSSSSLKSVNSNLNCNYFCTSGSNEMSLLSNSGNKIEMFLKLCKIS